MIWLLLLLYADYNPTEGSFLQRWLRFFRFFFASNVVAAIKRYIKWQSQLQVASIFFSFMHNTKKTTNTLKFSLTCRTIQLLLFLQFNIFLKKTVHMSSQKCVYSICECRGITVAHCVLLREAFFFSLFNVKLWNNNNSTQNDVNIIVHVNNHIIFWVNHYSK